MQLGALVHVLLKLGLLQLGLASGAAAAREACQPDWKPTYFIKISMPLTQI